MKSIYIIKKYLSLVLVSILLGACGDFFDINQDPNNPTEAELEQLLPASQLAIAAPKAAEGGHRPAFGGELLHPVIFVVGHIN